MNQKLIIKKVASFAKKTFIGAEGGHDWWHTYRVWKLAKNIASTENADIFIVELGALLHDIADSKFHNGNEKTASRITRELLNSLHVDEAIIGHVDAIVSNISFKGGNFVQKFKSLELNIVQDADRLDAIGAIGIARTFNYGGYSRRELYNPPN